MDRNFDTVQIVVVVVKSLSARRAWIEIKSSIEEVSKYVVSLSARRAWIEIVISAMTSQISVSLSARRAWIEIMDDLEPSTTRRVALRKESVDRNPLFLPNLQR